MQRSAAGIFALEKAVIQHGGRRWRRTFSQNGRCDIGDGDIGDGDIGDGDIGESADRDPGSLGTAMLS
jgi:hypothetical protein